MTTRISQLTSATLTGNELVEVSQLSASVTKTATTISADSTDNSYNDSGNGFVTAGFTTGKSIKVSGFTGNTANNITSGVVTSVAAGKIIIGGTDGDVIVTDAAGESVTITQWDSKRSTAQDVADLAPGAGRERLAAARTYYVRTDGSDSNDGLANTAGGAFLTIQKAVDTVYALDLSTYAVTIQVADGTYSGGVSCNGPFLGSGVVTIQGNSGTPANVLLSTGASIAVYALSGANITIKDFKVVSSSYGINSSRNAHISFSGINFGATTLHQVRADDGGTITATGNYAISGAAPTHFCGVAGGIIRCQTRTITITGTPAFSQAFADISYGSVAIVNGIIFSGSATGVRYSVTLNGVCSTNGGGANYFPGNSAGTTATGGQYA